MADLANTNSPTPSEGLGSLSTPKNFLPDSKELAARTMQEIGLLFHFPGLNVRGEATVQNREERVPLTISSPDPAQFRNGGFDLKQFRDVTICIDHPNYPGDRSKGVLDLKIVSTLDRPEMWIHWSKNASATRQSYITMDNASLVSCVRGLIVGAHLFAESSPPDAPQKYHDFIGNPDKYANYGRAEADLFSLFSVKAASAEQTSGGKLRYKVGVLSSSVLDEDRSDTTSIKKAPCCVISAMMKTNNFFRAQQKLVGIIEIENDSKKDGSMDQNARHIIARIKTGLGSYKEEFREPSESFVPKQVLSFVEGVLCGANAQFKK